MLDSHALADLIAELVGDHVDRATAPLLDRIAQLEAREPGAALADRLDVVERDLPVLVEQVVERAVAALPAAVDGKDADPDMIRQMVGEAIAALPAVKDGEPGAPGRDGHDVEDIKVTQDGRNVELSFTVGDLETVFKIELPEAAPGEPGRDGKDIDPEQIREMVAEAVAQIPPPKDGVDGKDAKLPLVREWTDEVHYEGDVVTFEGATYQAQRDTGRAPTTDDWTCLAARGVDGAAAREIVPKGTFDPEVEYEALNVVMLNASSFVAKHDNPGPCPGDGWQLWAGQGKRGAPGERQKGDPGRPGPAGPPVVAAHIDDQGMLTLVNGDGSTVTCDLYPVLSKVK